MSGGKTRVSERFILLRRIFPNFILIHACIKVTSDNDIRLILKIFDNLCNLACSVLLVSRLYMIPVKVCHHETHLTTSNLQSRKAVVAMLTVLLKLDHTGLDGPGILPVQRIETAKTARFNRLAVTTGKYRILDGEGVICADKAFMFANADYLKIRLFQKRLVFDDLFWGLGFRDSRITLPAEREMSNIP
jgi:hypothetical protein